jgi:hypothetical protein
MIVGGAIAKRAGVLQEGQARHGSDIAVKTIRYA